MRDDDENLSDDNMSEVDERGAKDDGKYQITSIYSHKILQFTHKWA